MPEHTLAKQMQHRAHARGVRGTTQRLRFTAKHLMADVEELVAAADATDDYSPGGARFGRPPEHWYWVQPEDLADDPLDPYGDTVRRMQALANEFATLNENLHDLASKNTLVQRPGYPDSPDRPFALTDEGVTFADPHTPLTPADLAERGVVPD